MMRFLVDDAVARRPHVETVEREARFGAGQEPSNTGRPIDEGTPGGQAGSEPAYRCGMKRCGCGAVVDA
jgi:hypothetical protein